MTMRSASDELGGGLAVLGDDDALAVLGGSDEFREADLASLIASSTRRSPEFAGLYRTHFWLEPASPAPLCRGHPTGPPVGALTPETVLLTKASIPRRPEVVLKVDYATDVRRRKLWTCEAWGFPEVWVDVPDAPSPSRPKSRRPGLTIHMLENGGFRETPSSRVFPGWNGGRDPPRAQRAGDIRGECGRAAPRRTHPGRCRRHRA